MELPWEEQWVELEMTDRKGYGLYSVAVPRENKDDCRCDGQITLILTA